MTCITKQRKQIVANSIKEAREIAERDDMEWQEKEEVWDTKISVKSGTASIGRYVEGVDDDGGLYFEYFDSEEHKNAKV